MYNYIFEVVSMSRNPRVTNEKYSTYFFIIFLNFIFRKFYSDIKWKGEKKVL